MASESPLNVQRFAFVWDSTKIFGDLSPCFKMPQMQFHLRFYFNYCIAGDYRLHLEVSDCSSYPFDISIYLIVGDKCVSHSTATIPENINNNFVWKSTKSEVAKIVPEFEKQPFRFIIIIDCRVADSQEKTVSAWHKSVQTPTYLDPKFQLEKLAEDIAKLLGGDDSSPDVEVVCGDRSWKAHRSLLSCRSDVFKAMLQSDMVEGKTGRVQIRDTEAGIFEDFLQHLYTGKLPEMTVDTAMRFYELGDKYSVEGLKRQCASFLEENMTLDNACAILSLADHHSDQDLKENATAYILDQKIPLQDNYWSSFCSDHPVLALAVVNRFCKLQATSK